MPYLHYANLDDNYSCPDNEGLMGRIMTKLYISILLHKFTDYIYRESFSSYYGQEL